jgi:hypothetical protein
MALRSALPFHNQWPTVNAPGQLPNDGSLTGIQSNAVQVGDICYERTGQVYYYCVVATVGAAVWQALGTVGPPLPDHQAHYYIVGNSLAGDTNSVCNFLDPGDGSGIAAALVAASSATPPRDVYVRPGTYTLIQQLDIAEGVRLLGAGRGRTRIIGYFDAPSIKMAPRGTELCDIDLVVQNSFATPAPGGFIDIRFNGVSANVEDPFAVRRVTIALQTISGSTGSPLAGIHLGGNDVDFVAEGNAVEDVVATTLTQQSYSPGTTYADMVVGLRGSVLAANLQPVWPRVNITNLCVEDWQGCTYLDGVNGAHRMCQYDGIRIARGRSGGVLRDGQREREHVRRVRRTHRHPSLGRISAFRCRPSRNRQHRHQLVLHVLRPGNVGRGRRRLSTRHQQPQRPSRHRSHVLQLRRNSRFGLHAG